MNDSSVFYFCAGCTGFIFTVLLSHLATTYGNLRLGSSLLIFTILSIVGLVTLVAIMYSSYAAKKFSKTAVVAGVSIGALLLLVIVVAFIIGSCV